MIHFAQEIIHEILGNEIMQRIEQIKTSKKTINQASFVEVCLRAFVSAMLQTTPLPRQN